MSYNKVFLLHDEDEVWKKNGGTLPLYCKSGIMSVLPEEI